MGAIGGLLMVAAGALFFYNIIRTLASREPARAHERAFELSETIRPDTERPPILDRLGFWVVVAVALVLIAYVPAFIQQGFVPDSPPWRLW